MMLMFRLVSVWVRVGAPFIATHKKKRTLVTKDLWGEEMGIFSVLKPQGCV